MVACLRPEPLKTIADPACGTVEPFLATFNWLTDHRAMNKADKEFLKKDTFHGNEIVAGTRRLALMNLFPHNIGDITRKSRISPNSPLIAAPGKPAIITSRPLRQAQDNNHSGRKSSITFTSEKRK